MKRPQTQSLSKAMKNFKKRNLSKTQANFIKSHANERDLIMINKPGTNFTTINQEFENLKPDGLTNKLSQLVSSIDSTRFKVLDQSKNTENNEFNDKMSFISSNGNNSIKTFNNFTKFDKNMTKVRQSIR